ncbi:hypothetical protein C8F01DRAFT_1162038 [Mycena amicta]|nr:hypothetical protein C8F01DRAFT_1162038 [Mycena amicta]
MARRSPVRSNLFKLAHFQVCLPSSCAHQVPVDLQALRRHPLQALHICGRPQALHPPPLPSPPPLFPSRPTPSRFDTRRCRRDSMPQPMHSLYPVYYPYTLSALTVPGSNYAVLRHDGRRWRRPGGCGSCWLDRLHWQGADKVEEDTNGCPQVGVRL